MAHPDLTLLNRWRTRRDADAFHEITLRYAPMVFGTCVRMMRNESEAEDLTQECFETLAAGSAQPRKHLGAWLHQVATRRCLDRLKSDARRKRREEEFARSVPERGEGPGDDAYAALDAALLELPADELDAIVGYFLQGRSQEKVAASLGVSRQTVSRRTQRGIERLQQQLKERGIYAPAGALLGAIQSEASAVGLTAALTERLGKLNLLSAGELSGRWGGTAMKWLNELTSMRFGIPILGAITAIAGYSFYQQRQFTVEMDQHFEQTSVDAGSNAELNAGSNLQLAQAASTAPAPRLASAPESTRAVSASDSTGVGTIHVHLSWAGRFDPEREVEIAARHIYWAPWESPPSDTIIRRRTVVGTEEVTFSNLPLGLYLITATSNGVVGSNPSEILLTESSLEIATSLPMLQSGTIAGRIADEAGNPVPNAWLTATTFKGAQFTLELPPYLTQGYAFYPGSDGIFSRDDVTRDLGGEGAFKLSASAPGYTTTITDFISVGTRDIDIVLRKGAVLSGRVTNAQDRSAISGGTLRIDASEQATNRQYVAIDTEGYFFASGLGTGAHRVELLHDSMTLTNGDAEFEVAPSQAAVELTLNATRGGELTGRVYEEESGEGIGGLQVLAMKTGETLPDKLTATTGEDGTYRISGLSIDEANYEVVADGAGLGRITKAKVFSSDAPSAVLDFAFVRGLSVAGRVIDAGGNSVAGASVIASNESGRHVAKATTDSDGAFTLYRIPQGLGVVLRAIKDGYFSQPGAPIQFDENREGLEIALFEGATLSGIVVDSGGNPRRDVFVYPTDALQGHSHRGVDTSKPDGTFTITGVPGGTYEFELRYSGTDTIHDVAGVVVEVAGGDAIEGIRLVCPESGQFSLAGIVVDNAGNPVTMADIALSGPVTRSARTDDKGQFSVDGLDDGEYTAIVSNYRFATEFVTGLHAGAKNVAIELSPRATISGQVVDARSGLPLARFELEENASVWGSSTLRPEFQDIRNERGEFEYSSVQTGTITLRARADGYAIGHETLSGVEPGEELSGIRIALHPGATVSGLVRTAKGEPIVRAHIAMLSDGVASHITDTDDNGAFVAKNVLIGAELRIGHPGFVAIFAPIGTGQDLEVTLLRGGTVRGVIALNGEPLADVVVSIQMPDDAYQSSNKTTAAGEFTFLNVPPGIARVECSVYTEGAPDSHVLNVEVIDEVLSEVTIDFQN